MGKWGVAWTIGGDFIVKDLDEDAVVAELKLHEPLRSMAIDRPKQVAAGILQALTETPHPFASEPEDPDTDELVPT